MAIAEVDVEVVAGVAEAVEPLVEDVEEERRVVRRP